MGARSLLATGLFVLAACATSPPVTFHTLGVAPGPRTPVPQPFAAVQVAALHLPPSLDRPQLVTQMDAGEIDIDARHRWSAPLADLARQALSRDLQARLPEGVVVLPDMPPPAGTAQIVVSLAQFGATAAGRAVLAGSWSVSCRDAVRLRRDVSFSTPLTGAGADAATAAMSDLLGELATDIATHLAQADQKRG